MKKLVIVKGYKEAKSITNQGGEHVMFYIEPQRRYLSTQSILDMVVCEKDFKKLEEERFYGKL